MTLRVLNHQLKHLKQLKDTSNEVSNEIFKLVYDVLTIKTNINQYAPLAEKINTTSDNLQLIINAIVLLIVDSIKNNITENDFEAAMQIIFSPDQIGIFWKFILHKRDFIENILKHYNVTDYRFRDLEWRIDARIASRSLLTQVVPIVTIKLIIDSEGISPNMDTIDTKYDKECSSIKSKQVLFQTDPTNLLHVINVLELALEEAKTHRTANFIKAGTTTTATETNA